MIRLSKLGRNIQVRATAQALVGGAIEVYDEPRYPDNADDPVVDAAKLLLRAELPDNFSIEGNTLVFKGIAETRIAAQGTPKRFRVLTKDGVVVFDGACGADEDGDDMILKRDDGGAMFYPGMRVQLDELRHTLTFEGD